MSRLLLSATAVFSVLLTTLLLPSGVAARRCDDAPPETLLSLYRVSSEIHLGKFDRTEDGAVLEETEDYTSVELRKHFSITSTLKGEPRKFYVQTEPDYRYKSVEETPAESEEGAEEFAEHILKIGDTVLIFLTRDKESGDIVPAHYRDGVKKIDAKDASSFERRVAELNVIFSRKKVDDAEIVAWLVKTAIDPVTRWEGAYELLAGYQGTEWRAERERMIKEKEQKGEAIEDWEREDLVVDPESPEHSRIAYVKLLTDAQKRELLAAAVEPRQVSEDETKLQALSEGDRTLIELVSRWGDRELARYLVDQLRANPEEQYSNAQLMGIIAKTLSSDRLESMSSRYGELYYDDKEAVSDEDMAALVPTAPEPVKAGEAPLPRMTYGELKTKMMSEFISLAEQLMTTEAK